MTGFRLLRWLAVASLTAAAIGGCARLREGAGGDEAPATPEAPDPAEGPRRPAPPADPTKPSSLSPAALELWNDPGFQRRFTESYIAETEIEPAFNLEDRDRMLKVMKLISDEKLDEAARLLERYTRDSANAAFDFALGNIYFQRDQYAEAAASYKVAVDHYGKFRRAWRNLGLVYIRRSESAPTEVDRQALIRQALEALAKAVELGARDPITYGLLGFGYGSLGDSLAAESAYRNAILLDPGTLDWRMGLAQCLFKQNRYADAAALCDTLIEDHPQKAELWLLQANAYIGMSEPMKAAENFEFVDRLGKSTDDSLRMLGDIYVNDEIFGLAVDAYMRAMEMDPEASIDRYVRAARVLTARRATDETRRLIDKIQTVYGERLSDADRRDLLKLQARLAVAEGAGEEEVRVLEEIVQLDPLDGDALLLLGQHAARSGDVDQAIFYYERAANVGEKYERDAKIRHAQLLIKEEKYGEAVPLLKRAVELESSENLEKYLMQIEELAKGR